VARPADRHQKVLVMRKIHHLDHVVRAGAPGDEGWPSIDCDIEYLACSLVLTVVWTDELAAKMGFQLVDCR
jgi:hypothetical protein